MNSPQYDEKKTDTHGKIFVLEKDSDASGRIDINFFNPSISKF